MIHVLTIATFATLLVGGPKIFKEETAVPTLRKSLTLYQEWKVLQEPDYSIEYPPTWELDQRKDLGTSFILFARGKVGGKFRENVNLLIQDLSGLGFDLNKYVEVSEQQFKTMTNGKVIGSKRIRTRTGEYHEIIYAGVQGAYNLKWETILLGAGRKSIRADLYRYASHL